MQRQDFKDHISERYNEDLEGLFNQVLEMGGLVESQLNMAQKAIENVNSKTAKQIKQTDKIVNKAEFEVDHLCARLLARQQPTASDMRLIVSAIRMVVDIERIGDESVNISKLTNTLAKLDSVNHQTLPGYEALIQLMAIDVAMINKVLDSFSQLDVSYIADIVDYQERVIEIRDKALAQIHDAIDNKTIDSAEYVTQIGYSLRSADRISKHVMNVSESIIYLVAGENVRHMNSEKLTEFLKSF
jgi:phosphate transport system protein